MRADLKKRPDVAAGEVIAHMLTLAVSVVQLKVSVVMLALMGPEKFDAPAVQVWKAGCAMTFTCTSVPDGTD